MTDDERLEEVERLRQEPIGLWHSNDKGFVLDLVRRKDEEIATLTAERDQLAETVVRQATEWGVEAATLTARAEAAERELRERMSGRRNSKWEIHT